MASAPRPAGRGGRAFAARGAPRRAGRWWGGGGGGGARPGAGGPQILEECRRIGGCPTGEARITSGGRLKARYVIHAVGPVYRAGRRGEAALLAGAYRTSLELATAHGIRSVSFPALSTGAYGYPIAAAARVAPPPAPGY